MSSQLTPNIWAARVSRVVALVFLAAFLVGTPQVAHGLLLPPRPMVPAGGSSDTKPLDDDYIHVPGADLGSTRRDAPRETMAFDDVATRRGEMLLRLFVLRTIFNILPR